MKCCPLKLHRGNTPPLFQRCPGNSAELRPNRPITLRFSAGLVLLLTAALMAAAGCAPRPAVIADPTAPPAGYQRHIMLVVETADFRPVAGAEVRVEVEGPTRLIHPAAGRGRTDGRGGLELVFEPLPNYDQGALVGGDIIVEFPIKAFVTVGGSARRVIDDRETFARYADPLYQGLNRDPEPGITYYQVTVGGGRP